MRTKLFGAFIAALVAGAFAALPAVASAEAVTLSTAGRGNLNAGDSVTGFSGNLKFGGPSQFIECTESEINGEVTANGTDPVEVEFENGGRFEGGSAIERISGMVNCPVSGTGGSVTARIRPMRFRASLKLTKSGGVISGSTSADFELAFHALGGFIRECKYSGNISVILVSGRVKMSWVMSLVGDRFNTGCSQQLAFTGEFELTHEGEAVIAS